MKTRMEEILKAARREAAASESWADLSNFLFDPEVGLVTKAFPNEKDRRRLIKSAAYRELMELVNQVRERTGFIEGATPRKSGKFVVRLPRSLHKALEIEAAHEGVSLNQLVVAKLAMQMSELVAAKAS